MECLVVGAGSVAERYLEGLDVTPALSVAAVCDLDADRARAAAERYDAAAYDDVETALADESAPLVVNLTSHAAHETVTRSALAADRHVFSEKPLAMDADGARGILALARERRLGLACAPTNPGNPGQRRAARLLADGRLGEARVVYADAHVGRVTEWHDDPGSFLDVGPLWDGAVYPLTLLVAWFGPVDRILTADNARPWPDREAREPTAPSHVDAVLRHRDGPRVRLTASMYTPHRSREFYGLEVHGDDGSLYLDDAGAQADAVDRVQFGRAGRAYTSVPPAGPARAGRYADGPATLARSVRDGTPSLGSARRGAHVVALCEAIERVAATGTAVSVPDCGASAFRVAVPTVRPPESAPVGAASLRLPSVGVEPADSETAERALDAGCRLLVADPTTAATVGAALSAPGSPVRDAVHLAGVVPGTDPVGDAVDSLRTGLGVDSLDSLLLERPTDDRWDTAVTLRERGRTRVLGEHTGTEATATREPALVATATPPAAPALAANHDRGTRVLLTIASPSTLVDDAAADVAAARDASPDRVAVARAVDRGVVPIVETDVIDALTGAGVSLSADERAQLAGTHR